MGHKRLGYLSYLLRLWFVKTEEGWRWRVLLESPAGGDSKGFEDLDGLSTFLLAEAERVSRPEPEKGEPANDNNGGIRDEQENG